MPLPVIAATVRATVRGATESGQKWNNTHHLVVTGGASWDAAHITTLDGHLKNLYQTAYGGGISIRGLCAAGVTFDDAIYYPLDGASAPTTKSWGLVGVQAAGSSLPSETSIVVTLRTALRGRSHRGRLYLPPFYTGERTTNGVFLATDLALLISQFTSFNAAALASSMVHSVASYLLAACFPITQYTIDNKFDVQRGRK